jgi:hypothetical protein
MFALCVSYSKKAKGKNQDEQDKERSLDKVERESKKRTSETTTKNPGGGEIFHTRTDRPWDPPSLLHNG